MPNIVKKYKVVDKRLQFINDIDGTYDDPSKPAVKLVQPISVNFGQYIDESLADSEMWHKSLTGGTLKKFIKEGLIKIVYLNEEIGEEVSKEAYENFLKTGEANTSEVSKIAKLLNDRGITAEKLEKLLDSANKGEEKVNSSAVVTQGTQRTGVLVEDTNKEEKVSSSVKVINTPPKENCSQEYEQYSKLPYQARLKSIPSISDINLLKEILQKDKKTLIIKTVNARLKNLGVK